MKKETERWLDQVHEDLATAKDNCAMEHYAVASFFSQQCAEKALKAYLIATKDKLFKSHDLFELGERAGLP